MAQKDVGNKVPIYKLKKTEEVMKYTNRLSDHLFVLSRHVNDGGKLDVLWEPGANQ